MSPIDDSLRIARTLDAPTERVYRAWTDATDLARWNTPGDGMTLTVDTLDVRVGGRYRGRFGAPGDVSFVETNEYRDVVPGRRLVFDMIIARGDAVLSRTRCAVDFIDRGGRTQIVLPDDGEGAGEHAAGWGTALNHLAEVVAAG